MQPSNVPCWILAVLRVLPPTELKSTCLVSIHCSCFPCGVLKFDSFILPWWLSTLLSGWSLFKLDPWGPYHGQRTRPDDILGIFLVLRLSDSRNFFSGRLFMIKCSLFPTSTIHVDLDAPDYEKHCKTNFLLILLLFYITVKWEWRFGPLSSMVFNLSPYIFLLVNQLSFAVSSSLRCSGSRTIVSVIFNHVTLREIMILIKMQA